MTRLSRATTSALLALPLAIAFAPDRPRAQAQTPELKMVAAEMKWRSIGPYRGGRTKAITGQPGQPKVFYIAAVDGGMWKDTHFGRT